MNRYYYLLLILPLAGLFFSCNNSAPSHPIILMADSLMDTHPDSTLKLLKTISHPENLSPIDHAEYTLLLTQALDKNNIHSTNDSLIKYSINYYNNTKNKKGESKAYYYLGRIYKNNALEIEAAEAFLRSIQIMPKDMRSTYLGTIYEELADCYSKQEFYEEAIHTYHLAYNHYKTNLSSKDTGIYNTIYGLSSTFILLEMNDSAYYYANKALAYAHSIKNRDLIYRSYTILTDILYMQGDHQKALHIISQSSKYIPKDVKQIATYYCWKGLLYKEMGKIDSAHYYWEYGLSISPQIDYFFYQNIFQTEKELGNWKDAVEMADSCISSFDSIQSYTRQEEMGNVLNKYKLEQYALQHQKNITYYLLVA